MLHWKSQQIILAKMISEAKWKKIPELAFIYNEHKGILMESSNFLFQLEDKV